jgi:FkbM family methyltransferase
VKGEVEEIFQRASLDAIIESSELLAEQAKRQGILLFGAGNTGRQIAAKCAAAAVGGVRGFLDDVRGGKGQTIVGLPVFSREEALAAFGPDVAVVVCIYKVGCFFPKLKGELTASGFNAVFSLPDFARAHSAALMPFYFFSDALTLFDHRSEIAALYGELADEPSKAAMSRWLSFRLSHRYDEMDRFVSPIYFPDFLPTGSNDPFVFVDCGAYDGDTVEALVAWRRGRPSRVIAFEPDSANFRRMEIRLSPLIESGALAVDLRQTVVGASAGAIGFSQTGDESAHTDPNGADRIAMSTVDNALGDSDQEAHYIKYDVEGSEAAALTGSQASIKSHGPMLAVSLYHRPEDLWTLPQMIRGWRPTYKFYLRAHAEEGMDTVLYAIDSSHD